MSGGEDMIKLAAKLYEARDTLRTLWGDTYGERMPKTLQQLRDLAALRKEDPVRLAMDMAKTSDRDVSRLILIAATVELMEAPDPLPPEVSP